MIDFLKPANLNGAELRAELAAAGIDVSDDAQSFSVTGDFLSIDIKAKDTSIAETVIANHNGTMIAPTPTIQEKLASVGLNLPELKAALGL
jgi:hypothetical protein